MINSPEGGNSPELRQEFASFRKSQLQEMLYLDDKQIEQAKPEMTAKEIREIRKPQNQEEKLEGQMNIEDYPEILPEEVALLFSKWVENVGAIPWYQVVKEDLKTAYTEDSAKIKRPGKRISGFKKNRTNIFSMMRKEIHCLKWKMADWKVNTVGYYSRKKILRHRNSQESANTSVMLLRIEKKRK